nr:hypothetical protein [Tepidanaerobacter syntrophicus]
MSFEKICDFFFNFSFSLQDVYRALDYFNLYKDDLLLHIHEMVRMIYGRDTSSVYYDVANYYFEIDESDDFRKKGVCKEHRPNPIVQMGLVVDNLGLPITYRLFEGNTNDCETLMPALCDLFSLKYFINISAFWSNFIILHLPFKKTSLKGIIF